MGQSISVDWELAEKVAVRVSEYAPFSGERHQQGLLEEFTAHTEKAEGLVAATTGLTSTQGVARARVVDRPGWIKTNLKSLQRLLRPLLEGETSKGSESPVTARITAVEMGAVLGWMSTRVLGQYDLLVIEDEEADEQDLVYYVGPNVVALEQRYAFPSSDFRQWLALHEVTHRAQFTGVPWLRKHYLGLVEALLDEAEPESNQIIERLRAMKSQNERPSEEGLIPAVATPQQKAALDNIAGLMSLLEGHGDVTMDRAGIGVVQYANRYAKVMRDRRQSATGLTRMVQKIIGLEAKLAQYAQGEEFIAAVEKAGGEELFNQVWIEPSHLPNSEEIKQPSLWINRMQVKTSG
mgnify:FL=1|tara:strand:- start:21765 stop:22817 length:1053 start_codon:yes stop_codon:yes gene_type:complete